jgi:anti-anti-sigma factor
MKAQNLCYTGSALKKEVLFMTIKLVKRPPNSAELRLEGRMDTNAAPAARDAFLKVAGEYPEITLDFSNLTYICSAGLRAILTLQKQINRTGGHLTLANVSPAVMEVFEMTGFSSVLHCT